MTERNGVSSSSRPGSGNLLLVEDNAGDIRLIREAFERSGAHQRLHVVKDGTEATAFLQREGPYETVRRPDVILMDLKLPKKDGHELLAEIRSDPEMKDIPVVVLSSSSSETDVTSSYELGANCYVVKPFDPDRYLDVVESVIDFWFNVVTLPGGP